MQVAAELEVGGASVGRRILEYGLCAAAEDRFGAAVDRQHGPVVVEDHKPLAHIAGDIVEFLPLLAQLADLLVNAGVLLFHPKQQRRKLIVSGRGQRRVEIDFIDGPDDCAGQQARGQTVMRSTKAETTTIHTSALPMIPSTLFDVPPMRSTLPSSSRSAL